MRNYVQLKTATVYSGERLESEGFKSNPLSKDGAVLTGTVNFKLGGKHLSEGSAAAMDRRSYFVTAAHCIEEDGVEGDVYLMFSRSKREESLKKARVVWSGRGSSGDGLDFAVLKIASPLTNIFDWGPLPEAND